MTCTSLDTSDPWARYRKQNGEFKRWLYMFHYTYNDGRIEGWREDSSPLPMIFPTHIKLSGEMIMAMYNVGMFKHGPVQWRDWHPPGQIRLSVMRRGCMFGMVSPLHGSEVLTKWLATQRKRHLTFDDLMVHLMKHHTLFRVDKPTGVS